MVINTNTQWNQCNLNIWSFSYQDLTLRPLFNYFGDDEYFCQKSWQYSWLWLEDETIAFFRNQRLVIQADSIVLLFIRLWKVLLLQSPLTLNERWHKPNYFLVLLDIKKWHAFSAVVFCQSILFAISCKWLDQWSSTSLLKSGGLVRNNWCNSVTLFESPLGFINKAFKKSDSSETKNLQKQITLWYAPTEHHFWVSQHCYHISHECFITTLQTLFTITQKGRLHYTGTSNASECSSL